ncbi:MAG: hypothetical protein LBE60_18915 [Microbacterium sp.]|jgi:hypothetical protein|uniref:hypothetical protein n=1 Tax=Microbacterium sp. TaxID=51671 RepID=UPI0028313126|nr:hypothetical protein [Microbacterium sp.]MDR2323706.1 hypothetical protein [Microbacterium sp.]
MTSSEFTQARADQIVAALAQDDVAVFTEAVAFAAGIVPTAEAVAQVEFPADLRVDASTFTAHGVTGSAVARAAGDTARLSFVSQNGQWKLDSLDSSEDIRTAR